MDLFTYLMARKGKKILPHKCDLCSYLLATHRIKIKEETGTELNINAKLNNIVSLKMSKESTQDGIPTPENPVEVKTVKGNVGITITDGINTRNYTIPLGNNEIAGIGTYKDELIIDKNGKCWLNKKIPKKIFTENDNWVRQSVYTNNTRYVLNDNNVVAKLGTQILSNYFLKGKGGTDTVNIDVNGGTGWLMITIPNTIAPTLVDFNNWLQTKYNEDNPVYALYVTTTSQLIDLNYTVDIELFKGINNISNSDDMDMTLKYY